MALGITGTNFAGVKAQASVVVAYASCGKTGYDRRHVVEGRIHGISDSDTVECVLLGIGL